MQVSQAKGLPPTPTTTTPPTSFPTVNGNRRVWVCRPGATPTTVLVPAELIVDDLKSVVLAKFPTSLQRTTDPADLAIRLPQSAQPPPTRLSNSHLAPPASPALAAAAAATEEYRTATSPHLTSFTQALRKKQPAKPSPLTIKTPSQPASAATSAVPQPHPLGDPLSPDVNVWQLLDAHFPHGMRMEDALVIEGETAQAAQLAHTPPSHHPQAPHPNHQPSHVVKQVITPHALPHQPHVQTPGQDAFLGPPSATDEELIYDDDSKPARKRRDVGPAGPAGSSQPPGAGATGASSGSPSQSPAAAGTAQGGVLLLPRQFRGGTRNSDKEPSAARRKGSSPAPDDKRRQVPPQAQQQQQAQQQPQQQQSAAHSSQVPHPPQPKPVPQQPVAAPQAKHTTQQAASDPPPKPTISITARPNGATITESPSNTNLHMLGKQKKEEATAASTTSGTAAAPTQGAGAIAKTVRKDDAKAPTPQKALQAGAQAQTKPELRRTRTPLSAKAQKGPTTMETIVPRVNVLIVEDNEINQKILEAFMRKRKIRSSVAKNGREALEKWRQGGYHLILMDIQLPVMSGILVTKEIRRLEHQNKIGVFSGGAGAAQSMMAPVAPEDVLDSNLFRSPVIIVALTASSLKEDKSEALAAGCNDFLTKPVNMVWLERKIMEWGCMQALIDFEGWKMWRGRDFDGAHAPSIGRALANTHLTQPVSATRSRSRSNSRLVRQNSSGAGTRSKLSMTPVASTSSTPPPSSSGSAQASVNVPTQAPSVPGKNVERPASGNKPAPEQYRLDPPKVEVPAK